MDKLSRKIVWPGNIAALFVVALALAVAVTAQPFLARALAGAVAIACVVMEHVRLWGRWRRAEVELLYNEAARRERHRHREDPRIALLAGEDFQCGEVVVVSNSGYVIKPERFQGWNVPPKPIPPPAQAHWTTGFVGDESELEVDDA